ncbi:MAG: MarR family transcriptional regulator [Acidimicrobiales bacterium]|nr:MarR family transcriptional regulator [Acidimicrobiales bacterium]
MTARIGSVLAVPSALDRATDALLESSRALVAVAARSLAEVDEIVTLQQYRALVVLHERDSAATRDLAVELGIHASSATRLCDRLVAKELVDRSVSDRDRRESVLTLSDAGRALVDQVMLRRREELRAIVRRMSGEELDAAVAGLGAFRRAVTDDDPAAAGRAGWW